MPDASVNIPILAATPQHSPTNIPEEALESPPTTPTGLTTKMGSDASPLMSPEWKYDAEEPLYTEINIPLPRLPKHKRADSIMSISRPRAHSLHHSFRAFHRRGSSSDTTASKRSAAGDEPWPRIKKEVKSKEVATAMNIRKGHRRSSTIDALAVVPAVLVLSAELFTPGEGRKTKGRGEGKWEDGMI
jgi:hypothetical protein